MNETCKSDSAQGQETDIETIRECLDGKNIWLIRALLPGDIWSYKELDALQQSLYEDAQHIEWVLMDMIAWGLVEELPKKRYRALPKAYEVLEVTLEDLEGDE